MNPINRFFVAILLFPSDIYAKWGVDKAHLRAILEMKLVLDDRRPNAMQAARKQETTYRYATIWGALVSLLFGVMFLAPFAVGQDYVTHLTLFFSGYMIILSMMLVSDFTSVLMDVRDNNIILPKPINDRTLVVARLLHIVVHICKLTLPMLIPCSIYLGIQKGWGTLLAFVPLCFLATLSCIFFINAAYLLVLRYTSPDRFKNYISYVQIVFAVVTYAAFQLVPRGGDGVMENLSFADRWGFVAVPPYWFATAYTLFAEGNAVLSHVVASTLALIMPIAGLYLVIQRLAPSFNQKLSMIAGSEGASLTVEKKLHVVKPGLKDWLAARISSSETERTGFLFTWTMMLRSREFKLKVYPSIGYLLVVIVLPFFTGRRGLVSTEDGQASFVVVSLMYMAGLLLSPALNAMLQSEKYKAAWAFWVSPISRPGEFVNGAVKAVLVQFMLPLFLLAIPLAVWLGGGTAILPDLLLAACNQVLIIYLMAVLRIGHLPFSVPVSTEGRGRDFLSSMLVVFLGAVVAILQYLLFQNHILIAVFVVLSCIATWTLMQGLKNKSIGLDSSM